ncbi:hypothetical protein HMPREF9598_01585 [Cutibacterium acnes HL050PA1]|nr:hypothetical protein HMPREF9598_01585 [Cutibacterium acnes HL050PA1]
MPYRRWLRPSYNSRQQARLRQAKAHQQDHSDNRLSDLLGLYLRQSEDVLIPRRSPTPDLWLRLPQMQRQLGTHQFVVGEIVLSHRSGWSPF